MIEINKLYQGDCLEIMKDISSKSIDMILCDLPYGTTACRWDTVIPFEPLWAQYERIIKDNGAIVLTASQPFTSALVMSNAKLFKYCWVWEKSRGSNFQHSKFQPLKTHEDVCIFSNGGEAHGSKKPMKYNRQKTKGKPYCKGIDKNRHIKTLSGSMNKENRKIVIKNSIGLRCPISVQYFSSNIPQIDKFHPTQKPVKLFKYLIKTYTNECDLVLDNCAGSGTSGVACKNLNRNYIMIEKDPVYCKIIKRRMSNLRYSGKQLNLFKH